jgi:hypothetical protein
MLIENYAEAGFIQILPGYAGFSGLGVYAL